MVARTDSTTIPLIIDRYKYIVWLIAIFILAMGFDFKLPSQRLGELDQSIRLVSQHVDTLNRSVLNVRSNLELEVLETNRLVRTIIRLECRKNRAVAESVDMACEVPR